MDTEPLFEVDVRHFEPHSLRGGRGGHKAKVKRDLYNAILKSAGEAKVRRAQGVVRGKLLDVDVDFSLMRKKPHVSDTTEKKDLDNLLKPLLDVLQTRFDSTDSGDGLGLIENDEVVFQLSARKELVETDAEQGFRLVITEWVDSKRK